MRIDNRSARHPTHRFLRAVDFVSRNLAYHDLVTLRITDRKERKNATGGYAWKDSPYPQDAHLARVAPALIELQVSSNLPYPILDHAHVPEVGDVRFDTWEEEIVFVLSHEARHVWQFYTHPFDEEREAEVDAEKSAVKMLAKWRKQYGSFSL